MIKKLDEKPLVPYDNVDDTTTDDSVEITEGVVTKQGPSLNEYSDSKFSRKTIESSSTMPASCKWNKDILNGNYILEDIEVSKPNLEAENTDNRTEKPKFDGGRNILKRALANIIEKEKLKVDELKEVSDVKQKKRKTKKKKKRRKELLNEEDSGEKSSMTKSRSQNKLVGHRV